MKLIIKKKTHTGRVQLKPETRRPASFSLTFLQPARQTKPSPKADKFEDGDSEAGIEDFKNAVHETN